ncbi:hypothetical protein IW261DRAFT_1578114 [Armillaria novae-zelandiae]|uniref:Ubiquitin-like protease family profile domain-containing protein n=1 Tax=Armillaria novae-zelandiae TaxID=153914 RepID=A0AA39N6Q2_9AGAR|nr:hypothetical protein IW261DRAFT_1578114 [Armillaria novae-zelandiae]
MAYWKKVITAGGNIEEHDGHVPDIETREGLLDVCALGNLLIYLPALSGRKDLYWDDLRFAFSQYWELVSWANEHLLSAQQFGQALLDYNVSVEDCPLYEALDSEDRFHRTWFRSDVMSAFDQTFGNELRTGTAQGKPSFRGQSLLGCSVWDQQSQRRVVMTYLPVDVPIHSYADIPVEGEESDSSGSSSSLTGLSDTEEPKSPAPHLQPMLLPSPERQRRAQGSNVSESDGLTSSTSEVEADGPVLSKKRLRLIEISTDEGSSLAQPSSDEGYLAAQEGASQATWQVSPDVGLSHHQSVLDEGLAATLTTSLLNSQSASGAQVYRLMDDDLDSPPPGELFDLEMELLAERLRHARETADDPNLTAEDSPGTTDMVEQLGRSEVDWIEGELDNTFHRFINCEAFSQGSTDERLARGSEQPLTCKHALDASAGDGAFTSKRARVQTLSDATDPSEHITDTSDILVGLTATSLGPPLRQWILSADQPTEHQQPNGGTHPMAEPLAAVPNTAGNEVVVVSHEDEEPKPESPVGVSNTAGKEVVEVSDAEEEPKLESPGGVSNTSGKDVIEVSDEDEEPQSESMEDLFQWREKMKTGLQSYLKEHQPLVAIHNDEGSHCDFLQCVTSLLDTNRDSCWRFQGVSTPLEKKSLGRLIKLRKSWLDDGVIAVTFEVLCQDKAFKNIMKAYTELGHSDFILPIHEDNHWFLFHLNLSTRRIVCYDSLGTREHSATNTYNALWSRFERAASETDTPFHFKIAENVPRQNDSINCGVYTVAFAWYMMRHRKPPSAQDKFWCTADFADRFRLDIVHFLAHRCLRDLETKV